MTWLELHNTNGRPVWVNMDAPISMVRVEGETHISSGKDLVVVVKEVPEEILRMLEERL